MSRASPAKESWSVNDSVLHHLTDRVAKRLPEPSEDADLVDDLVAFGWSRGVKDRNYFIEFRKKDGIITALPYMMLERVDFDPSEGITLKFAAQTVRIIGRNLDAEVRPNVQLLNGILRHKVPWIREMNVVAADRDQPAPIVEALQFGE
jgi:hypothetical protein